jgi:hypothetical protein
MNEKPITREEKLLANIAGESYEIIPRNREEYWLSKIAESRGGGGGSSDPFSGYDLVIRGNTANLVEDETEFEVLRGDYNAIKGKAENGMPIRILAYGHSEVEGAHTVVNFDVLNVVFDEYEADVPILQFTVAIFGSNTFYAAANSGGGTTERIGDNLLAVQLVGAVLAPDNKIYLMW